MVGLLAGWYRGSAGWLARNKDGIDDRQPGSVGPPERRLPDMAFSIVCSSPFPPLLPGGKGRFISRCTTVCRGQYNVPSGAAHVRVLVEAEPSAIQRLLADEDFMFPIKACPVCLLLFASRPANRYFLLNSSGWEIADEKYRPGIHSARWLKYSHVRQCQSCAAIHRSPLLLAEEGSRAKGTGRAFIFQGD